MSVARNWATNHAFRAARLHRPATIDEARRLVARASRVHVIGAGHSFNGAADSDGDLIDLSEIAPDIVIDVDRKTATAGAGTSYGVLAALLEKRGWALHNMASLPHVTLAGATATGTHGSGDRLGTLSSAVAALDLITATGDPITVRRGDPAFQGMVVNLGALGAVTRVTLDIQPSFQMRQDAYQGLSWDRLLDDFDSVMSAGYSVSLMTKWGTPSVNRFWIKSRLAEGETEAPTMDFPGVTPAPAPVMVPTPEGLAAMNPWDQPGPWSERLPHFRPGVDPGTVGHLQSEYLLPRAHATEAFRLLRGMAARIDPLLLTSEVRGMLADDLWLSPAQGRDTIGLHFSWIRDLAAVPAITAEVEALLLPLGARPHWGKIIHTDAGGLTALYPRLPAFQALVRAMDPDGKFRNAFLEKHVLGP